MADTRLIATYYRSALLLGLVTGERVIAWADDRLADDAGAPAGLAEVSTTPPGDLTALRHALAPLGLPVEPPAVVHALLDRAAIDWADGRRNALDTLTVLRQIRRFLRVPTALKPALDAFDQDFIVAAAGLRGSPDIVFADAREWLAAFAGAEAAIVNGVPYLVLELPTETASAFAAALSRAIDAPPPAAGGSGPMPGSLARAFEVWAVPAPGVTALYLSEAAFDVAARAFAPLPAMASASGDELPSDVRLVVDGPRCAMGTVEAHRALAGLSE